MTEVRSQESEVGKPSALDRRRFIMALAASVAAAGAPLPVGFPRAAGFQSGGSFAVRPWPPLVLRWDCFLEWDIGTLKVRNAANTEWVELGRAVAAP